MSESRWRVGRKLGRTLYRNDHCVGMVDSPELAAEIVAVMNGAAPSDREWIARALGHEANRIWNAQSPEFPSNVLDVVAYNLRMGETEFLSERKHPSGRGLEPPPAPAAPDGTPPGREP